MPIQKILFGSPGTGKSHRVDNYIIPNDLGIRDKNNIIKTVFHPEYTYGDFMGKLMPLTVKEGNKNVVTYNYFEGHFLKAIAQAYKQVIIHNLKQDASTKEEEDEPIEESTAINNLQNVVLVIDEINRGNSAAIFGTVFQLLDREKDVMEATLGWSTYSINVSKLEFVKLIELIGLKEEERTTNKSGAEIIKYSFEFKKTSRSKNPVKELNDWLNFLNISENQIRIPNNLHILATMNTSDNSIYFMDNAFKRRWDWEFVNVEDDNQRNVVASRRINLYGHNTCAWNEFVDKLNGFIRSHYKTVRKIEDKQIGYFFINEQEINDEHIKNKLMFFVWDSVFNTNRKPLTDLLEMNERDLVTFGQFTQQDVVKKFVQKILQFDV